MKKKVTKILSMEMCIRDRSGTMPTQGVTVAMGGMEFGTKLNIGGQVFTLEDRGTPHNVVVGNEESVCHFPFGCKGFPASRRTQDKPVRVFELLPVAEYHVI